MAGYIGSKAVILSTTGADISGSVVLSGTVDGRDVSVDGTKLDGIDTAAKDDQTAAEILTAVKTVDGAASGLDADLLDGQHGAYYTAYADTAVTNLVDNSPAALNTLNELAAALGDDASFSTTVTNSIAAKLPLAGGTMTGAIVYPSGTLNYGGTSVPAGANNQALFVPAYNIGLAGQYASINWPTTNGAPTTTAWWMLGRSAGADDQFSLRVRRGETAGADQVAYIVRTTGADNAAVVDSHEFYTGASGGVKRMAIDSSGNVGIGESNPSHRLHINGGSNEEARIRVTNTANGQASLDLSNGEGYFRTYTDAGAYLIYDQTDGADRFVIDTSGNVGIGTSPSNPGWATNLHVHGSGNGGGLQLTDNTSGSGNNDGLSIASYQGNSYFINRENAFMAFSTDATERMRITSSGYVGIGVASPSYPLEISLGQSSATVRIARGNTNTGFKNLMLFASSSASADVGAINITNNSTQYATSSDYRLKTDAQPMVGASARVQALNPVNFEWIADGSRVDGFLAHEAQEVVPECATGTKDAMMDQEYEVTPAVIDENGTTTTEAVMGTRSVPDYQGIDQAKIVPLLTAALREALTKIDDMETRLAALEDV